MEKICKGCGKHFERKYNAQKFCKDCVVNIPKNKKQNGKTCKECGKLMGKTSNAQKFCSYECQYNHNEKIHGKGHYAKPDGWIYHGECPRCGKHFESNLTRKYCSKECQYQAQLDKAHATRREYMPPCRQCGRELPLRRKVFCSKECEHEYYRKTDKVPLTFEIISARITERYDNIELIRGNKSDGFLVVRCKICGGEFQIGEKSTRNIPSSRVRACPHCAKPKAIEPPHTFPCVVCGKPTSSGRASKCCSDECRAIYARQQSLERGQRIHLQTVKARVCKHCGVTFTPEYGDKRKDFCSKQCCKKYSQKYRRHISRARKKGNGRIDCDITLDALSKRDKNTCHICGGKCDKRDFVLNFSGAFVVGDSYPSIDHVMPMSKGGTHTWDNVNLAHCKCNRVKSDLLCYEKTNSQMALAI